ncbi:hypothetical protein KX816_01520 [Sphingosinicellaceae bacterium]|nr:hypothetical protein KX816_01520 [Sphingosinicellaceae bacterium]
MKPAPPNHRSNRVVFRNPAIIAVATLTGLVAGLLGDGVYDGLAWLGLGIPVVVIVAMLSRRRAQHVVRRPK